MAYDEQLADRIRLHLEGMPRLTERRMFGGIAFMVDGNMSCGLVGDLLMVRVGPDDHADALAQPGAAEMTFTGRPMGGFVQVEASVLGDDEVLADWVDRGVDYALRLPPK